MKNTNTKLLGLLLMCQLLIVPFQMSNAEEAGITGPSIPGSSTSLADTAASAQPTNAPTGPASDASPTDASVTSTAQPTTATIATPTMTSSPTTTTTTAPTATTPTTTTTTTTPTRTTPTTTTPTPTPTTTPTRTTTTTTTTAATTTTTGATTTATPSTTPLSLMPSTTEATTATSATVPSQTQPVATSTLAPSAISTAPPSTTSQPGVQSSSASVSAATTAVPKPNVSDATTTAVRSLTTTARPATTAVPSTTTPAKSAYPTKQPEKPFQVVLDVGDGNDSVVYCKGNISCTFANIAPKMRQAFMDVPGYLYLREGTSTANRRKRDTRFSVDVLFDFAKLSGLTQEARSQELYKAMQTLNTDTNVGVNMDQANTTAVAAFAAADLCSVPGVCPGGYSCEQAVCHHLCEEYDCGSNGVCNAVVNADGLATAHCVCNSDDEHTYSGERCQEEETSKAKVASIVGGVLGAFCALFLLLLIFLAYRLWHKDGGSKRKYQLGGYSNNGYADQEFAMKNVATDNP